MTVDHDELKRDIKDVRGEVTNLGIKVERLDTTLSERRAHTNKRETQQEKVNEQLFSSLNSLRETVSRQMGGIRVAVFVMSGLSAAAVALLGAIANHLLK